MASRATRLNPGPLGVTNMSWNYRVVQRDDEYAIHEVFYSDDGTIKGMTVDQVFPRADTIDELREELGRYRAALDKPPLSYQP